ncbi:subtilisin-like protease SBT3.18 [Aristolochia californica]|uniref:subtilisin-like protease SBT3.18 n=1 Tax=Aristolochia californica TaxID=171875 RepID=UPI0035E2BD36
MATYLLQSFWGLFFSLSLCYRPSTPAAHVHIVYLGLISTYDPLLTTKSHLQLLSTVFTSEEEAVEAMVYSYRRSFSGFAAMLNATQATTLAEMEGVISVFRSKIQRLHTTRSWDFMGLPLHSEDPTPLQLAYGDDVVVGVFDTGIWPESGSFREGPSMPPIPTSWKGKCVKGEKFDPQKACNRKLIGARYYIKGFESEYGPLNTTETPEFRSPRDQLGHGTHTASTAVGSIVNNANFFGLGSGIARGGAPRARLAMYKMCWSDGLQGRCTEADIMAAFDDAISDRVNVISASFGLSPPLPPFFSSSADIGSFHAAQLGISVVFSAGNDGPEPSLVQNVSPWSTCVAASSIDRSFPTKIVLGDNNILMGKSFNVDQLILKLADSSSYFRNGDCEFDKWTKVRAKGVAILCFSTTGTQLSGDAAIAVFVASGSALIFAAPLTRQIPQVDLLPVIFVDIYQGTQILHYIMSKSPSSKSRTVQIFPSRTVTGESPAPVVADFSSRGPSSLSPNILKPDITAPGVNILAAWPPVIPPSSLPIDTRSVNWNFDSGTSMACPHVTGLVALLKSAHPDWSPAAIMSAMITTAYNTDTSLDTILAGGSAKPVNPFDVGGGHVNPLKAMDPGLVYDMNAEDYALFLCILGYTKSQIASMLLPSPKIDIRCPKEQQTDYNLNYPSIVVSDLQAKTTIKRTVRNVGFSQSIYFVEIVNPNGVQVSVWPRVLVLHRQRQEASYYVTLTPLKQSQGRYDFGEIVWFEGHHRVRSPLVVRVNNIHVASETAAYSTS